MCKSLYVVKDVVKNRYLGFDKLASDGWGEYEADIADFTDPEELRRVKILTDFQVELAKKQGLAKVLVYRVVGSDIANLIVEKHEVRRLV